MSNEVALSIATKCLGDQNESERPGFKSLFCHLLAVTSSSFELVSFYVKWGNNRACLLGFGGGLGNDKSHFVKIFYYVTVIFSIGVLCFLFTFTILFIVSIVGTA